MFHRWYCRVLLLGLAALTAAAPAPGGSPPARPKSGVRPMVALGPAALAYGRAQFGPVRHHEPGRQGRRL